MNAGPTGGSIRQRLAGYGNIDNIFNESACSDSQSDVADFFGSGGSFANMKTKGNPPSREEQKRGGQNPGKVTFANVFDPKPLHSDQFPRSDVVPGTFDQQQNDDDDTTATSQGDQTRSHTGSGLTFSNVFPQPNPQSSGARVPGVEAHPEDQQPDDADNHGSDQSIGDGHDQGPAHIACEITHPPDLTVEHNGRPVNEAIEYQGELLVVKRGGAIVYSFYAPLKALHQGHDVHICGWVRDRGSPTVRKIIVRPVDRPRTGEFRTLDFYDADATASICDVEKGKTPDWQDHDVVLRSRWERVEDELLASQAARWQGLYCVKVRSRDEIPQTTTMRTYLKEKLPRVRCGFSLTTEDGEDLWVVFYPQSYQGKPRGMRYNVRRREFDEVGFDVDTLDRVMMKYLQARNSDHTFVEQRFRKNLVGNAQEEA
jgi:hypothetical protein